MKLLLPEGDFRAYLFDCDGTIADSMPVHYRAWTIALEPWGCSFSEQDFYDWAGRPVTAIIETLNRMQALSMPVEEVSRVREIAYQQFLPQVKAVPEVIEVIEQSHGDVPLCVVSGSPRASVQKTLETLGLSEFFEFIIGAEDVSRGKPWPDPFLAASTRLGLRPEHCLVFEDSELGIRAATAACMKSVRVIPTRPTR